MRRRAAASCGVIPLRDDNPVRTVPIVTVGIAAACAAVFLWQLVLAPDAAQSAIYSLGLIPAVLFGHAELARPMVPPTLTILTSLFLHGGLLHLGGNMLYLWIFGDNIEDRLGHGRFIAFYVVCGAVAALAQALPDTRSTIPMIGASGAVSGVLGAYLVLYPRAHVLVALPLLIVFYTFRVPALVVLALWFGAQLISALVVDATGGGVAFRAHVGGFVAGLLLIRWFPPARRRKR